MKRWSKYLIKIRASILVALLTLFGAALILVFSDMNLFSEEQTPVEINKRQVNRDSAYIVEKVKSYYKLDTIKVAKLDRLDLDNNGINNGFVIAY